MRGLPACEISFSQQADGWGMGPERTTPGLARLHMMASIGSAVPAIVRHSKEGSLFNLIRGVVPTVKAVHFPMSGACRFNCHIYPFPLFRISIFGFYVFGGLVTNILWVTCPHCEGEFYRHYQELWHKKIKLLCPYCSHQFLDEESSKIIE